MAQEFVDKADLTKAQGELRAANDRARRLTEENDTLKRDARAQAEAKLTAELVARFAVMTPDYPGGQYEGLSEAALPDGRGKVQVSVSKDEPGSVHIRAWGPAEIDPLDPYSDGFREDFRCTFVFTYEGVAVQSLDFHKRYR